MRKRVQSLINLPKSYKQKMRIGIEGRQASKQGFLKRKRNSYFLRAYLIPEKINTVSLNIHNFAKKVSLQHFRWRTLGCT